MNPFEEISGISYENLYHFGMVVPDVEAAKRDLSAQLGVRWAPTRIFPVGIENAQGDIDRLDVAASYSQEGPPFFELIGAIGDGIFGPRLQGGLHHIGLYAADLEAEIARLEQTGFTLETRGVGPDGSLAAPIYMANGLGLRVELAGADGRDMIAEWVRAQG